MQMSEPEMQKKFSGTERLTKGQASLATFIFQFLDSGIFYVLFIIDDD